MKNELWKHSSIAQALIAEGREEGRKGAALRITRIALTRRFGGLDEKLIQALEQMDIATLEDLVADPTLTLEHVQARLGLHQEPSISSPKGGIIRHGKPARVSPLGGYRS